MIIDSDLTFEESIKGSEAPQEIIDNLELINIQHIGFDEKEHQGQLLVDRTLSKEIKEIFEEIKEAKFKIEKIIPIVKYGWNDIESVKDNNSSAFNYRKIHNKEKLSNHSFGKAIDINPVQNPYIDAQGHSWPNGYKYNVSVIGTITENNVVVNAFKKRNWDWGGNWKETKGYLDYQHFAKK